MAGLPNRLYGADLKSLQWGTSIPSWETAECYAKIRSNGLNFVRRHFPGEPIANNNAAFFNRIRHTIDRCAENNMFCMFDLYSWNIGVDIEIRMQQEHNWDRLNSVWPDSRWNAIWTNFGNFVKNDYNVYLELGNEPDDYGSGWTSDLLERQRLRYQNAITLLRGLGYENTIIIPGISYGTSLANWPSRASSLNDNNIAFDIHYYQYHQGGSSSVSAITDRMNARGCDDLLGAGWRVMVGEFGCHSQNPPADEILWLNNFLTVQNTGYAGQHYDSCFQSFQPGYDFPSHTATSYVTNWFNYPHTTWYQDFLDNVPSNLEYYTGEPPIPPPEDTYELIYAPTTSLPIMVTGNVGYTTNMVVPVSTLANAIGAYLRVTVFDTADGGSYGSGNEEGYVQIGSSMIPLPVSAQAAETQGDVNIAVADLIAGDNTFVLHYELTFTGYGYEVRTASLHVVYQDTEGQPFTLRIGTVKGMGYMKRGF